MSRLTDLRDLPDDVVVPGYDRDAHGEGIVHLGLGAFHRAHQAVYTDDALAAGGGDWRIVGVSLRNPDAARELEPQGGLFTLVEAGPEGRRARVVGAISRALAHAHGDATAVRSALADPAIRIVTITVTEKGYGLDRTTGGADLAHPAIAHDLASPDTPVGVAGLIVQALARRRADRVAPFAVLSCDNLPGNGALVRGLILDVAARTRPSLVDWIAGNVAFPGSMVDRITPAPDDATRAMATEMTGHEDRAAIMSESFRQWVIEDRFPEGRPAWEAGGALFVGDVAPYEDMKLRMLNGAHTMLACAGVVAGYRYVRDVMADADLASLVRRHLAAAAGTVPPLPGIDLDDYANDLARRFQTPDLAHETRQIAMDCSEKMPQRIFAPAQDALAAARDTRAFAFAIAIWAFYCLGRTDDGAAYDLNDPRASEITGALSGCDGASEIVESLAALPALIPADLIRTPAIRTPVEDILSALLRDGARAVIGAEARR